jgi:hypothetical protein
MKKIHIYGLLAFLMLVPFFLASQTPTNYNIVDGYFSYQKDVEGNLSHQGTKKMASIYFNEKTFNFVNYCENGDNTSKIVFRKITFKGGLTPVFNDPDPNNKYDVSNLKGLGKFSWQPAPVIFKDTLYLFVGNKTNGISFSKYNDDKDTWSATNEVKCSGQVISNFEGGMAAVTVDDELCVIFRDKTSGALNILHTKDPFIGTWTLTPYPSILIKKTGSDISAITTSQKVNGKLSSLLTFAYFDDQDHPRCTSMQKDDGGNIVAVYSDRLITSENKYSSVALVEGTVKGDPNSTGRCIQAFLKKSVIDNNMAGMYRIQQFQLKGNATVWTKSAENLVPQTSPHHYWACKDVNLSVVNIPVDNADGKTINQLMCLLYMGYDTNDYPLNCAWSETDYLKYDPNINTITYQIPGDQNKQHVGYIEGPPPFFMNNYDSTTTLLANYLGTTGDWISTVTFGTESNNTVIGESSFGVEASASVHIGPFKAGLSASYEKQQVNTYSETISHSFQYTPVNGGISISLAPVINFYAYVIYDTKGTPIDTTYNGVMGEPVWDIESDIPLGYGFNPADPATYHNGPHNNMVWVNAGSSIGSSSVSWSVSGAQSTNIEIDTSQSVTNTMEASANVEIGPEFLSVGVSANIKFAMTTTSEANNAVECKTDLRPSSGNTTNIKTLDYTMYWLKPSFDPNFGLPNWWLKDPKQNTWCVTYAVTKIEYNNGIIINSIGDGDESALKPETDPKVNSTQISSVPEADSYLFQNYPNPVKKSTVIKFQVGSNGSIEEPNSLSQGTHTKLEVYDLRGFQVASLVDEVKQPGQYQVEWDASQFTPGVYFYSLQSGSFKDVKKMVLLK